MEPKVKTDHIKEITDRLESGIQALFSSEQYKTWLTTMSKFHNYSLNNTLLISMQMPEASLVAGYNAWSKNFGRQVRKGEKAIRIIAPAPYKAKTEVDRVDPVTGEVLVNPDGSFQKEVVEVTRPAFKIANVFDVSQTDGKELPTIGVNELTGDVRGYSDLITALRDTCPVPVTYEDIRGGAKGYYHQTERRIAIQRGMSQTQTIKTLVHEMAHQKLHAINPDATRSTTTDALTRNGKEVEAESVAFTICCHYGIDTSDYSFAYIAGWSEGKELPELKASLATIRNAASEMITTIDAKLHELTKSREPLTAEQFEARRSDMISKLRAPLPDSTHNSIPFSMEK